MVPIRCSIDDKNKNLITTLEGTNNNYKCIICVLLQHTNKNLIVTNVFKTQTRKNKTMVFTRETSYLNLRKFILFCFRRNKLIKLSL